MIRANTSLSKNTHINLKIVLKFCYITINKFEDNVYDFKFHFINIKNVYKGKKTIRLRFIQSKENYTNFPSLISTNLSFLTLI